VKHLHGPDSAQQFFRHCPDQFESAYGQAGQLGYSLRVRMREVLALFDQPGGSVLDVGCGPGILVERLADRACRVVGLDLTSGMLDRARRRCSRSRFVQGDAMRLPFKSARFDAVIAMGLSPYLSDEGGAFREMARVLRGRGSLIATFQNAGSPCMFWRTRLYCPAVSRAWPLLRASGVRRGRAFWAPPAKAHTEAGVTSFLDECGYTLDALRYYNFQMAPSPLDDLFPLMGGRLADRVEQLVPVRWHRWLANGFVVRAHRR
jgi:ubiquinone/menaquinone biosynthesis C-methylase UbiE